MGDRLKGGAIVACGLSVGVPEPGKRIHQAFEGALAERPGQAELLREMEYLIVQQPDDSGPGFAEPVEIFVQQMVATLPGRGTADEQKLLERLRRNQDRTR